MCGICGIATVSGSPRPDEEHLHKMCQALARRGPDGEGMYIADQIGLGHRRLAIIDQKMGAQPMWDPGNRYCLIYNGEIYNFIELRQKLENRGEIFFTNSDTEVILRGLLIYGIDFLQQCNGMFALALWDTVERKLLLVRDRLGIKPLYWARVPNGPLLFASEASAIASHPLFSTRLNLDALGHYLILSYLPGSASIYEGIQRLEPGSCLIFSATGEVTTKNWWSLADMWKNAPPCPEKDVIPKFVELLDSAVSLRLISDVPVGAFLSSGIDSASIVSSMCRAAKETETAVRTFSMAFGDASHNEAPGAAATATFLGTTHTELEGDHNALSVLHLLAKQLDEPFADTSIIPSYMLCSETKKHVNVALSGDGGDELLAGYTTLQADDLYPLVKKMPAEFIQLLQFGQGLLPEKHQKVSFAFKLKQFLNAYPRPVEEAHASWRMLFNAETLKTILPEAKHQERDIFAYAHSAWKESEGLALQDRFLYMDYRTWMQSDILVKADRASMNNGLESRAPFLDFRLIEFCAGLPQQWKRQGGKGKILLHAAMQPYLPKAVLQRKKLGFNAPVSGWLFGPWREVADEVFSDSALQRFPFIQPTPVARLWKEHREGKQNHGFSLFNFLLFFLWAEAHKDCL